LVRVGNALRVQCRQETVIAGNLWHEHRRPSTLCHQDRHLCKTGAAPLDLVDQISIYPGRPEFRDIRAHVVRASQPPSMEVSLRQHPFLSNPVLSPRSRPMGSMSLRPASDVCVSGIYDRGEKSSRGPHRPSRPQASGSPGVRMVAS
jgi:hypothetical protein